MHFEGFAGDLRDRENKNHFSKWFMNFTWCWFNALRRLLSLKLVVNMHEINVC